MGGSGGGGVPVGPTPDGLDCEMVTFDTTLERVPDAPVHQPYTRLQVLREQTETGNRIAVVDENGNVVGVLRDSLAILNKCMDGGTAFAAYVKSVSLGVYNVTIQSAS